MNQTVLMVAAVTLLTGPRLVASPLVLATNGTSDYVITLSAEASKPERTAANELVEYLKKVTGADIARATPAQAAGRPVIAVGPGAAKSAAPELDLAKAGAAGLGEDGIVLKSVGRNLILTGAEGSKRGTLYAVSEFLEREVGVRWWTHAEEFVPCKPSLAVGPLDMRYKPPFLYREVFGWGMVPDEKHWGYDDSDAAVTDWRMAKFAARLRNNGHGAALPASLGGCIMPLGWCHTFYPLLPPEKYFKDHPEWYSEIDGKRTGADAQLCMTSDAMLAELTGNVLEKARQQPHLGMVVVTQNDWQGNCQCPKCKAMDDAEGSPMGSLLYGVNQVAQAVAKEFPDFLVATHAYQYSRKPPKTIRPRDNVVIWLCVIERSAPQPINSDYNRRLMEDLQGWAKVAPRLFIWDYTMNLPGPIAPHPNWQVFAPDLRAYRDNNAIGCFMESESTSVTPFVELKVYLMAHLLWNPARDEAALLNEFLDGYYGAAASPMRKVMRLLEDRAGQERLTWRQGHGANWLDLSSMNRATELFRQAETAVAREPALLSRVRRARLAIDCQWLHEYTRYRAIADHSGLPFLGPASPSAASTDFAAAVRTELGRWPGDYMATVLQSYMGKSFDACLNELSERAVMPANPGPLPPMFQATPRRRIIDLAESLASVFQDTGAGIVEDTTAANGLAMRVPKAKAPSWAVQAKTRNFGDLGGFGRYHIFVVARCESTSETGAAFVGGVWDSLKQKMLGGASFPLGPRTPAPASATVKPGAMSNAIPSGAPVVDGDYHVFDFGVYDLTHSDISVWVGTTTGDLYVDRFVFVKE